MKLQVKTQGSARRINAKMQRAIARQIPYAASRALNDIGKSLVETNKRTMKRVFDDPVRYTLNAFYTKPSRKDDLYLSLRRKDKPSGKHYLEVQAKGGARGKKGVEEMLTVRLPYRGDLRGLVPTAKGAGPRGNISMAKVLEALAGVGGTQPNAAFTKSSYQKRVDRRHKAAQSGKKQSQYFIGYKDEGKAKTDGIYRRSPAGKKVTKVFHLLEAKPRYKAQFDKQTMHRPLRKNAVKSFPPKFKRNLKSAFRTARF